MIINIDPWSPILITDYQNWSLITNIYAWSLILIPDHKYWSLITNIDDWSLILITENQHWLLITNIDQWSSDDLWSESTKAGWVKDKPERCHVAQQSSTSLESAQNLLLLDLNNQGWMPVFAKLRQMLELLLITDNLMMDDHPMI